MTEVEREFVEAAPSNERIASLVDRLIACSADGASSDLLRHVHNAFSVDGILERIVAHITGCEVILNSDIAAQAMQSHSSFVQDLIDASAIESTGHLQPEFVEANANSNSQFSINATKILLAPQKDKHALLVEHMGRIVPGLMLVFLPGSTGNVDRVLTILAHIVVRFDSAIDVLIHESCRISHVSYLLILWRSMVKGHHKAQNVLESIICKPIRDSKASNTIQHRYFSIAESTMIESTLRVLRFLGLKAKFLSVFNSFSSPLDSPTVLADVSEFVRHIVDFCVAMDHAENLLQNFTRPETLEPNIAAIESVFLGFMESSAACMCESQVNGSSEDNLLSFARLTACLSVIHSLGIRSSGRCNVLPTRVDAMEKKILKDVKRITLHLVARFHSPLWGTSSLLFSANERVGTTSMRVQVLELMVETASELHTQSTQHKHGNFPSITTLNPLHEQLPLITTPREKANSFFLSIPWNTLVGWMFSRYRHASIVQALIYKLIVMVFEGSYEDVIRVLLHGEGDCELLERILEAGAAVQGYARLVSLTIHRAAKTADPDEHLSRILATHPLASAWQGMCDIEINTDAMLIC
ncbi:hypothetical protein HDU80_006681 [Chytriomyces hyalinus]|nr:hypothetical protein HDU80_006681 [Chytriomyces hyalinus]